MKLTFVYQPVEDLGEAVAFYRDRLAFEEAWREGEDTVAFSLPGGSVQIMLSTDLRPPGLMYLVDSVDGWIRDHPDIDAAVEKYEIPGGSVASFSGPGGSTFYVFDQPQT